MAEGLVGLTKFISPIYNGKFVNLSTGTYLERRENRKNIKRCFDSDDKLLHYLMENTIDDIFYGENVFNREVLCKLSVMRIFSKGTPFIYETLNAGESGKISYVNLIRILSMPIGALPIKLNSVLDNNKYKLFDEDIRERLGEDFSCKGLDSENFCPLGHLIGN